MITIQVKRVNKLAALLLVMLLCSLKGFTQDMKPDSNKIEYRKIYSSCLDGNIVPALNMLAAYDIQDLSPADLKFKKEFESRFKESDDKSDFLSGNRSSISALLEIYRAYWRQSLLNSSQSYDSILAENITRYLKSNFEPARGLVANSDSIDVYLVRFIQSHHLHTTGFGKTGKLYDLLVWKTEKDTIYSFTISKEQTSSRVILMNDFITLGWEEYATLGKYYPGGWSTKEALYCVQKAYDMNSEAFLISYLAHESRHFSDFKLFPDLPSADLEYRAKLTEISMAEKTIFKIIEQFINNANSTSENGHTVANYRIIQDLSKKLFNVEFEKDIAKWNALAITKIQSTAASILKANTRALKRMVK